MKKNLKTAILLCVLAGGVLIGHAAMAAEYTQTVKDNITLNNGDTITVDNIGIDSSDKELTVAVNGEAFVTARNPDADVTGINATGNNMSISGNDNAVLNITAVGGEKVIGIGTHDDSSENRTMTVDPDLVIHVESDGKAVNNSDSVYGISASNGTQTFNGDIEIDVISGNNNFSAIETGGSNTVFNGKVNATIQSNEDINPYITDYGVAAGISTAYYSNVTFQDSVDLNIDANSSSAPVVGILSTISNSNGRNIVTFNDATQISVKNEPGLAVGVLCAGSASFDDKIDAVVNFRNDVTIETAGAGAAAILAQDYGIVDISKEESSVAGEDAVHGRIIGDIQSAKGSWGSAYVNLNLTGTDSLVEGDIYAGAADGSVASLALHDGAVWRPTGTMGGSLVTALHMDNGVIEQNDANPIELLTYSGAGNINFAAEDEAADGVASFENVGNVTIENAEEGASVTLGIANNKIDTLDIGKTEESLNALAKKIFYDANNGNLTGEAVIREGLITPEARGDLLFDANDQGYVTNITGGDRTTDTMYAMKNLAATAIVAWRQEDSTFSQRLGELRESTGGQGIWARMSRGEFEYDGEYKNQYNFFQLGYDWASDNWHYGVAVSHNDGETAYTYGSGENRSTSLSLYGTWLGDAGHYADIVLKQGRLSNDFDVYTSAGHTSGDYDAWGTSLSGEYGKKILLENDWYVTPQAQLTLMRIGGEDYDTNNGIHVRQDTLYSAVGRLGFELGRKLDEKGSVYAKASVLHDFAGNAETYLSYNGFTNSYSQDLSDTWFEAGLGFNYRTGDNSYIYADVVRTFGGDVETPWQWNIGMRWSC